jgi:hypothetical protein
MTKWADYCISAVRYNEDETHIVKVKVYADKGDTIGDSSEWKREKVVSEIEGGTTFVTIFKGTDEKWKKSQDVHVVKVNANKYMRTDKNSRASDNLENLSEF